MIDKLSVCLDTIFSDPVTRKYHRRHVGRQLEIIRSVGIQAFELWDWKDKDIKGIRTAKDKHGLKLTLMAGQRRFSLLKEQFAELEAEIRKSVAQADDLECERLTVMVDEPDDNWHFTKTYPGLLEFDKYQRVVNGLSQLARMAEHEGVTLCLEHFNTIRDHPGYWLDSVETGFMIVDRVGSPNLKLLLDIYHMGIMEGNVIEKIRKNLSLVGHVHIASVPGRNEPYGGELNYLNILTHEMWDAYSGFFGLEYYPTNGAEELLRRAVQSLTGTVKYLCPDITPEAPV